MPEKVPYQDPCPFCLIAIAHPYPPSTSATTLWQLPASASTPLLSAIPSDPEATALAPQTIPEAYVILRSQRVLAFLDIQPMTRGHVLVATRAHREKLGDVSGNGEEGKQEAREVGMWLPLICRAVSKVTGVEDYNIVQNNGARAAQVVPHVHFHIIPRPESMPQIQNKSWTMFGRGQRDDLDEEEAKILASELRVRLRREVKESEGKGRAANL